MTIATRQLSAYALLAVPLAFASLPLYMYMPDFYATQHGMSLVTLGMILLGIRAFDAVQDPLLGVWARRWQGNPQRMHRGMVGALIVLAVGVVALMCPAEAVSPVWWFTLSMAAATTALSLVTILYQSLGALWSADYHQRTRITTAREGFTLLGVLIAVSTPALLQQYYTPAQSFVLFAVMFIALLLPAAWLWLRWLRKVSHTPMRMQALPPLMPVLRQAKGFFVVWFLSQLASAVPVVLVLFYIRDRLQLEAYTGAFLLIYFVSGAAGMPLWRAIEKRWGKKKAWQAAMAIAIFSFVWAFMLQAGDGVEYALICVFSGFALGGELAIPPRCWLTSWTITMQINMQRCCLA